MLCRWVLYAFNMSIELSNKSQDIKKFLNTNTIGVLATADSSGQPHAATIYFTVDDELNLYFMTKEKTRKHRNIIANPKVSVAVFEPSTQTTVQIQGTATQVTDIKITNDTFNSIVKAATATSESAVPPVSRLVAGGYTCYCLKPQTVRMAVYTRPNHDVLQDLFDVVVADGESLA